MKELILGLILHIALLVTSRGQYFTVEDIELGIKTYLSPATIDNLQWLGNSNRLLYSDDSLIYSMNALGDSVFPILSLNEFNRILSEPGEIPASSIPPITSLSDTEICFVAGQQWIVYNVRSKGIIHFSVPDSAGNLHINPDRNSIAYTLGNNIFIQDQSSSVNQVTFDSLDGIKNGDIVSRNEFGIETGLFWSPFGNYLAYYRKDERCVSKYPLVDIDARVASYNPIRYPMAGMKSEETEVWIYSLNGNTFVKLQITGDREQYHTNLSWTPDERLIYLQHLNRDQDSMVLKSYSTASGELSQVLFTEVDKKYVEPLHPLVFSKKLQGDFFYQSERDGFNHIYYYSASDKKLDQLTSGNWEVTAFLGTDESEQFIYFTATKDSPLENNLYSLDLESNEIKRLTKESGTHEIHFNKKMTAYLDEYSSFDIPRKITICSAQGNNIKELLKAENPVRNFELGQIEEGTILAADQSTPLYYQLIKPINFKRSKKYPVIIYVYGGPHVQLVTNSWMDRTTYLQQYLAQHGIASFVLDPRGSDLRGREFEDIIYRQSGIPQLEDQMQGIKFLKSLRFIDSTRIGVHGWSYGGYLTLSMMVNYPDVFKVGVAGGPVTDWKYYEVMYGERYMDRPEENPEGYEKTSLIEKAANLQGKLLIIHGGIDPIVVPQQSLLFIEECIKKGKQVDYFVYPNHEHNVAGRDRVHLTRMITDYFIENL